MNKQINIIILISSVFLIGCFESKNNIYDKAKIQYAVKILDDSLSKEKINSLKNDLKKVRNFEIKFKNDNTNFKKINVLLLYGQIYMYANNSYSALEYLQNAKLLSEQTKEDSLLGLVYLRIGQNFSILKQNNKAIYNYNKAISILLKFKLLKQIATAQNNIGLALLRQKKYRAALIQFNKTYTYYEQTKKTTLMISALNNLGDCYLNMNNLDSATLYFSKAMRKCLVSKDSSFLDETFLGIANLQYKKKQFSSAILNAKKGYKISKKFNNLVLNHRISLLLFNIYSQINNFEKSLFFKNEYDKYNAVILEEVKQKTINSLQYQYVAEQQKSINIKQQNEINYQKKNNLLLAILSFTLFLLGIYVYVNSQKTKKSKLLIEKQKEQIKQINITLEERINERTKELQKAINELLNKNREIEVALLKGQTLERKRVASELHDGLGSHLVALQWSMMAIDTSNLSQKEVNVYEQLQEMIKNAYIQVRNISHNMLPEDLEKYGIKVALTRFINTVNLNNSIAFVFDCVIEKIENSKIEFELYQILLEFINNTIKYSEASKISIEIKEEAHHITIFIKDDGIGFDEDTIKNSKGKGLKSILERTQSINGEWKIYKELNDSIDINNRSKTCHYFKFPTNILVFL